MAAERLERQIQFVKEIDKLKQIQRQTMLIDRSKMENSAEHSWHIAVMAIFFSEYAGKKNMDIMRVLKMVLIHDLVEIDAGDTYCYDEETRDQNEREERAANRIFNILPPDQAEELFGLWREFEARMTPESRFAAALDRIQPLINNYSTGGEMWKKKGIRRSQVLNRNRPVKDGAPLLGDYAFHLIEKAVTKGYLRE
jgi:putative hydrolase of HD superfamily